MFGANELIVILFVIVAFIFVPLGIIRLGKKFPNKLWLAILLSVVFSALGQFYLPGGLKYFIILALIFGFSSGIIGSELAYPLTGLLSIIFIWRRMIKVSVSPNYSVGLKE